MYEDIFESIRQAAKKRNLRERTIQLYCSSRSSINRRRNVALKQLRKEWEGLKHEEQEADTF